MNINAYCEYCDKSTSHTFLNHKYHCVSCAQQVLWEYELNTDAFKTWAQECEAKFYNEEGEEIT